MGKFQAAGPIGRIWHKQDFNSTELLTLLMFADLEPANSCSLSSFPVSLNLRKIVASVEMNKKRGILRMYGKLKFYGNWIIYMTGNVLYSVIDCTKKWTLQGINNFIDRTKKFTLQRINYFHDSK